jgi:hypothetical protein
MFSSLRDVRELCAEDCLTGCACLTTEDLTRIDRQILSRNEVGLIDLNDQVARQGGVIHGHTHEAVHQQLRVFHVLSHADTEHGVWIHLIGTTA